MARDSEERETYQSDDLFLYHGDGIIADKYPGEDEIYESRTEEDKEILRQKLLEFKNQKPSAQTLAEAYPGVKIATAEELKRLRKEYEESSKE